MKKFLNDYIFHNFGLKCGAVFLAVLLWVFVGSQEKAELSVSIPVEITGIPPDMELVKVSTTFISATLQGYRNDISRITSSSLESVIITLPDNIQPGETIINLTKEHFEIPPNITLNNFSPSSIAVTLEKVMRKKVEIKPILTGEVADGYTVDSVVSLTPLVEVYGPESIISSLETIPTEKINVSGYKSSFIVQARLKSDNPFVHYASINSVLVEVNIKENIISRELSGIKVEEVRLGEASVNEVSIVVRGPKRLVDPLNPASLLAKIKPPGNEPGEYILKPEIYGLPKDIELLEIKPPKISFIIPKTEMAD